MWLRSIRIFDQGWATESAFIKSYALLEEQVIGAEW
jgi:hypothetical protein